jgi:histidine ammonia-lyase
LVALLNAGITPLVPRFGSLGASGDLAPLAHVGLCLLGEGRAYTADGALVDSEKALRTAKLAPTRLNNKDGLALINGTDGMLAMLVLACVDLILLLKTADITAAMSIEALFGTDAPFTAELQALRPHPGQARSAGNIVRLLAGSGVTAAHRDSDHLVQDSYSLRCSPQVAGAARDTLEFATGVAERELASAIDNPVVLRDGRVKSNGNFHGAPLGYAMDFLAIASCDVGSISERRTDRLMDPSRSEGLPAFLSMDAGVNSGLMISAYTAAALLSENRRLAVPASVDNATTSAMQEDHVSMGWNAGLKLRESLVNLARILAVELVAASVGLYFRQPLEPAAGTAAVRDLVLSQVGAPGPDRYTAPELEAAEELIRSGAVVAAAEAAVGALA